MATNESQAERIAELERALAEKERELEATRHDLATLQRLVELAPRSELAQGVEARAEELRKATEELRVFAALFEHAADALVIASPEGDVTHVNPAYLTLLGGEGEPRGRSLVEVLRPADEAARNALFSALVDGRSYRGMIMLRSAGGEPLPAQVDCYVVRSGPEAVLGLAALIRDLSAEKRADAERAELEARVIASQEALIRELSTPLIPIAEGVLAMPLVGSIGAARGEQILEALLAGVGDAGAQVAILDITGVTTVDAPAAEALLRAARATRLLGAEVVVTGIGPAVAQTLIELGVDLQSVVTRGTLQAGIAYALGKVKGRGR